MCERRLKDAKCEVGCHCAHSQCEIDYHPLQYKTRMCPNKGECRAQHCPRAHSVSDLRLLENLYGLPEELQRPEDLAKNSVVLLDPTGESPLEKRRVLMLPYDPDTYKMQPCENPRCLNSFCDFYHSPLERRRDPAKFGYIGVMCPSVVSRGVLLDPVNCIQGDRCSLCHTLVEYQYHPENLKRRWCPFQPKCRRGARCPDRHDGEETLESGGEKAVLDELVRECEIARDQLAALNSVAKDWRCGKCGNLIESPAEAESVEETAVCRSCAMCLLSK